MKPKGKLILGSLFGFILRAEKRSKRGTLFLSLAAAAAATSGFRRVFAWFLETF